MHLRGVRRTLRDLRVTWQMENYQGAGPRRLNTLTNPVSGNASGSVAPVSMASPKTSSRRIRSWLTLSRNPTSDTPTIIRCNPRSRSVRLQASIWRYRIRFGRNLGMNPGEGPKRDRCDIHRSNQPVRGLRSFCLQDRMHSMITYGSFGPSDRAQ